MFESKGEPVKESFHPQDDYIEGNKNLEKLYHIVLNKFKELGRPIRLQSVKQFAEKHNVDFLPVVRSFTVLDAIPDGLSTGTYRGEECIAPNYFWNEFNAGGGRRANDAVNKAAKAINNIQADKRLSVKDWLNKHIQKISFELPSGHLRSKYPNATFKAEKELERTFLNRQEKFANDFELFNFKTGLDFTSKDNKEILPNVYITWRNIDEKTKETNPKYYDEYWNIVGTITFDTEIKNAPDEVILEMEKAKAKSKDEKSRTLNKNTNVISSNAFCQEVFQLFGNSFDFLRNKSSNKMQEKFMVEKKNLTEQFMSIHEKPSTRFNKNLKKVYEMLDKYGTEHEDVDKVFSRATLKERLEMVKLLKEGVEAEGKTVVEISITIDEPYYDHGDLCGIYETDVILNDSKVDAFIADLTSYCDRVASGDVFNDENADDWDDEWSDTFYAGIEALFNKYNADEYYKKKGDKVSMETFEYDLYKAMYSDEKSIYRNF